MNTRNFCITLPECPDRTEKARNHFRDKRLYDVTFFNGIHAEKAGLKTLHTYEIDNPGTNFSIGFKPTGIFLSHYMLWGALNLLWDEHFMIFEDDVMVPDDWHTRTNQAMSDVPRDFDVLYVGSCCVEGRNKTHVKGEVWECKEMMCTHAMILAKKCLPVLLSRLRKIYAPVDIAMMLHAFPELKTYVVLPRIFTQFDTNIAP